MMELLKKDSTLLDGLYLSIDYKNAYEKMACGTRETFFTLCDDIDFNIAIINNALSTGYYIGDNYKILWESKCNFITAKNTLERNTLQFLGLK